MREIFSWQVIFGLLLVLISVVLYFVHYIIFRDMHHIFIYLLGDIAFLPIGVLFVTLIIHRLLGMREKRAVMEKLNMVIGAFFSEVGTQLLKLLVEFDPSKEESQKRLFVTSKWSDKDFNNAIRSFKEHDYEFPNQPLELDELKAFLLTYSHD